MPTSSADHRPVPPLPVALPVLHALKPRAARAEHRHSGGEVHWGANSVGTNCSRILWHQNLGMESDGILYDILWWCSDVILCHPMSSYYLHIFLHPPKKAMASAQQASSLTSPPASRTSSSIRSSLGISEKKKRPFSEDSSPKSPKSPKALKISFSTSELSPILLLRLVLAALALSRCRLAPGLPQRPFHGVLMTLWRLALRASRWKQRFLGWRDQNVGKDMKIPITISRKSDKIRWFSPEKLPKWYQITSNNHKNHKIIQTLWRLIEEIAKCLRGCRDMFGPTWGRQPLSLELNMEPKLAIFNGKIL